MTSTKLNQDKYSAIWVSHSSISDFLKCPRLYYLHNIYRDPASNRKITLTSPALALGQIVHETLESLSVLAVEKRFNQPLLEIFNQKWEKISGSKTGFENKKQEEELKQKGRQMISRVIKNPGPLANLAVKIKADLPHFWLSEKDNLILCGKIDWLEYFKAKNSVHIIDFKTGKTAEDDGSLQLPIYHLLAANCQQWLVSKASYWYLERDSQPTEKTLPDLKTSYKKVLKIAKKIKLHRQLEKFDCPEGKQGCRYCRPYEKILKGEAVFSMINDFGHKVYFLKRTSPVEKPEAVIL